MPCPISPMVCSKGSVARDCRSSRSSMSIAWGMTRSRGAGRSAGGGADPDSAEFQRHSGR
jgi:hypothetical protein